MNNDNKIDLEGQIQEKRQELEKRTALLDNYARTIGRDRWYNRGQHDLTTLRDELYQLLEQAKAAGLV